MIPLIIISVIVLIIAVLLNIPLIASISYVDEDLDYSVKYLWFVLFPKKKVNEDNLSEEEKEKPTEKRAESHKINKSNSRTGEKVENPSLKNTTNQNISTKNDNSNKTIKKKEKIRKKKIKQRKLREFREKAELIINIIKSSKKGMKKLLKGININKLYVDVIVADEDAYETAINYGKISAVVYNLLALIRVFFTVNVDKIQINTDFDSKKSKYDISGEVKLKPITIINCVLSIFLHYMINNIKNNKTKEQAV